MRVTQNSITRTYLRNLNRNLSNREKSNEKLNSLRSFSKVSEAPAEASKAFVVREQMYRNEQYSINMRDASGELNAAEGNLMSVVDIMKSVKERIVQGSTGTYDQSQLDIIASEIDNYAEQVMQFSNAKFGSKYLFSGSSNGKPPFEVDASGQLLFNGMNVNNATKAADFPENKDLFIDVGMGLTMTATGEVDERSALKISTSGVDCFGFGTTNVDGEVIPNNVYSYLKGVAECLRDNDKEALGKYHEHLDTVNDNLMISITDLGNRQTFIEKNQDRMDKELLRYKEVQKNVEGINIEEETTNMKTYEMAWGITLQLGSKLIPPSIFDFMR